MTLMRDCARTAAVLAAAAALAGCSRELTTICAGEGDYLGATTAAPIRVPEGLTVPDESEALRVPDGPAAPNNLSGCLDAPPLYSEAPGAISTADEPSRRERRRERRATRDAEEASEAAQAPER
jgi:uncharacterized lipoprotein